MRDLERSSLVYRNGAGSDCSGGTDCSKWAFDPGAARIARNAERGFLAKISTELLLTLNFWGKFSLQGKNGRISLRGNIFPLRDNFPLKIALPFPRNGLFSQEMKGLRKRSFDALRDNSMTFPRKGKYTSSHFLPQKNLMFWGN